MRKIPNLDKLDCVGLYCKLDPMRKGYLESKDAVNYLVNKINDMKAFGQGSLKLKKWFLNQFYSQISLNLVSVWF